MKTNFSEEQLAEPRIQVANQILGSCQHFGFCTSGCPTYVITHDENDGPRGRIDLIKEMLEKGGQPSAKTVDHLDRCLSCMSCMTTCAVQVDYLHLVDVARVHIEENYRRPLGQRVVRGVIGYVFPRPAMFRVALKLGRIGARFKSLAPQSFRHYFDLLPAPVSRSEAKTISSGALHPAQGEKKWRVALLAGCVQPGLSPQINDATIRLLTRLGCEVVIPPAAGCCGSLPLHMGKQSAAIEFARKNVAAWLREMDGAGLDALLINASGCGSTVKDYAHLLQHEGEFADAAARIAAIAMDISEWLARIDTPAPDHPKRYRLAYHDACSLRNVQKITAQPRQLLTKAGFQVVDIPEAHFCCGSAGTYNMLQPEMARQLGERKAKNIQGVEPQLIAAGNIGCITQIRQYSQAPIVHTVELLDWAYGGPCPYGVDENQLVELPVEAVTQRAPVAEHAVHFTPPDVASGNDLGVW